MFGLFPMTRALEERIREVLRRAARRGLAVFCGVETLATAIGVGSIYQVSGHWPTAELWLAVIGLSTIAATTAEHLVVGWTLKRAIQFLPFALASAMLTSVRSMNLPELAWKFFRRQP
jgi:hypothetical protein